MYRLRRERSGEESSSSCSGSSAVAMAIDKNKSTQYAMRWAVKNVVAKDQTLKLVHVRETIVSRNESISDILHSEEELFLTYRCFCRRKRIEFETSVVQDDDVAKGLIKYIFRERIEIMVIGSEQKNGFLRLFRGRDISGNVMKYVPDFCTVYVISSKGKMQAVKHATCQLPRLESPSRLIERWQYDEVEMENSRPESRCSSSTDSNFERFYEIFEDHHQVLSPAETSELDGQFFQSAIITAYANNSIVMEECEQEAVEELKEDLKQTLEMYHQALIEAKQKVAEVVEWKRKEEKRLEGIGEAEEEKKNMKKLIVEIHRLREEIIKTERSALDAFDHNSILLQLQSLFHILLLFLFFYFLFFHY
ncbi:Protein kinase protein with adenine nucleotide alpha hydrolases-like domain [Euphorbia peplus]|nr:Protein kinase protein with adenine nucleotide alpha hydrolases-like domain [Euphorbia peplus]